MAIYAIGDLHFSPNNSKPMDIFGWGDHREKIIENWNNTVKDEDIVIVAGDISWALKFDEARENLDEINLLKGKKIFIKGNHDYWWQSLKKLRMEYPDIIFLQNDCYFDDKYLICGTRGWLVPDNFDFKEEDIKIYNREVDRLKNSIQSFNYDDKKNIKKIFVLHYPPFSTSKSDNKFLDIIDKEKPDHVVYGHLHGEASFVDIIDGDREGVIFHLVSSDYLDFKLKKITD